MPSTIHYLPGIATLTACPTASMILGSVMVQFWTPGLKLRSAMQQFAAGVVLAAVAVELLPTVLKPEINTWQEYVAIAGGFSFGVVFLVGLAKIVESAEGGEEEEEGGPGPLMAKDKEAAAQPINSGASGAGAGAGVDPRAPTPPLEQLEAGVAPADSVPIPGSAVDGGGAGAGACAQSGGAQGDAAYPVCSTPACVAARIMRTISAPMQATIGQQPNAAAMSGMFRALRVACEKKCSSTGLGVRLSRQMSVRLMMEDRRAEEQARRALAAAKPIDSEDGLADSKQQPLLPKPHHPLLRPLPWGLLAAVATDATQDGLMIGICDVAGHGAGLVMTIALTVEMCFLGVSTSSILKERGTPTFKATVLMIVLPLFIMFGGALGGTILSQLEATPWAYMLVISFCISALLYLVADELIVEARKDPDSGGFWIIVQFFLGFLLVLMLSKVGAY